MSGQLTILFVKYTKSLVFAFKAVWAKFGLFKYLQIDSTLNNSHFEISTNGKNDVSILQFIAILDSNLTGSCSVSVLIIALSILILLIIGIYLVVRKQNNKLAEKSRLLEIKNAELEKHNLTKDKLFSIIAHDLKGPIGNIGKLLEMMLEEKEMRDDETIMMLKRSSENTYNLLENMLTWARGQKGDIDYKPVKINLHAICNYPLGILGLQASNKNITLTNAVDEKIDVFADVYLLRTVLRNLISNAIKYTHQGGTITISAKKKDANTIAISVIDNGVGIEADRLNTIFEPVKNKNTKGTSGERGTGLGLLITLEFVELNKGNIWAESIPGKGTTITFTIPSAR